MTSGGYFQVGDSVLVEGSGNIMQVQYASPNRVVLEERAEEPDIEFPPPAPLSFNPSELLVRWMEDPLPSRSRLGDGWQKFPELIAATMLQAGPQPDRGRQYRRHRREERE